MEFKIRIEFFKYKAQNLKFGLPGSFFRTLGIAWGRYASVLSGDACCINRMLAIFFRALFYIKLRVAARICFSITCYIDGMLEIFFRADFDINLRVEMRVV